MTKTNIIESRCSKWHKMIIYDTFWVSYIWMCPSCWEEVSSDYFLNPLTKRMELMTKDEALKIGWLHKCPECWEDMENWEKNKFLMCLFCASEKWLLD